MQPWFIDPLDGLSLTALMKEHSRVSRPLYCYQKYIIGGVIYDMIYIYSAPEIHRPEKVCLRSSVDRGVLDMIVSVCQALFWISVGSNYPKS